MTIALSKSQYLQTRSMCLPRQLKGDKQAVSPRLANACNVLYQDAPMSVSHRAELPAKTLFSGRATRSERRAERASGTRRSGAGALWLTPLITDQLHTLFSDVLHETHNTI